MGRSNGEGGGQGPDRRRDAKGRRRWGIPNVESLERRAMLDAGGLEQPPAWTPTNTNLLDVKNGPLAKAGADLIFIYDEYVRRPVNNGTFVSSKANVIQFQNASVGVTVKGWGDFNGHLQLLRSVGMNITATDPTTKQAAGWLPISSLPAVAQMVQTVGVAPIYRPIIYNQGASPNQANQALNADQARAQFNVTGAGVMVGVLSDTVSQVGGGLAASVATGDLPPNVIVLADGPVAGASDEGRAMLEQIYDIAPGATLAFHTAFVGGEVGFANGIRALAQVGSQVIVDDVGYATEPMFQDGIVARAVTEVTNNFGVSYFSSAGNSANRGYEAPFRLTNQTVGSAGAGRFMDFDPGAGVVAQLPVTVALAQGSPGVGIVFQYDQPFYTTNGVVSDVDVFVLRADGSIVAQATTNNIATQTPFEFVTITEAGSFTVAIRVTSGPDVGRVRMREWGDGQVDFSTQFGTAGDTTYPTTFGHAVAREAIGVGAVPFYGLANSEDFSSFGPVNIVFDPAGNRLGAVERRLKPDLSGTDGNNTSFFGNPPGPGNPANGQPGNVNTLPNFFGTSSAAPNVAAVAALMKQQVPSATPADIRNGLLASVRPLNGSPAGQWDPQGGFGLISAPAAINAIDLFRVTGWNPAVGQTVPSAPNLYFVRFNRPVNPATVQASDLEILSTPPGVAVVVGQPITYPNDPTLVAFPLSFVRAPGANANGLYQFRLNDGSVASLDGKPLVASLPNFNLQDVVAPRVANTQIAGRIIQVTFTEAVDPATVNLFTFALIRHNNGVPVNVLADPLARISYDPATRTATIDLNDLLQTSLPSDFYNLVIAPDVTDLVGNRLDGDFVGTFPSGNGVAGGFFVQNLGFRALAAPQVTFLSLLPASDTGIPGDQNTRDVRPTFIGSVAADFPGSLANLEVLIEFNNGVTAPYGEFSLTTGGGGRGFSGNFQVRVLTDANGVFVFQAPGPLPNGFNRVRVVVVGQTDQPPLPGLSSSRDFAFRVDTTSPLIVNSSIPPEATINQLTELSLFVTDPIIPTAVGDPLAVPTLLEFPALDPTSVSNLSNYRLINLTNGIDYSDRIASATFVPTTPRPRGNTFDPYSGRIDLRFAGSLPAGRYALVVKAFDGVNGLRDAAGNSLDGDFFTAGIQDFVIGLNIQTEPVYLHSMLAISPNAIDPVGLTPSVTGPRAYYEVPAFGQAPRADAPPSVFLLDFSAPLDPATVNNNTVWLVRSANGPGQPADGDFGSFGITNAGGFTRVPGVSVALASMTPGAQFGQIGFQNRLIVTIQPGTVLEPDYYRLYIPNAAEIADLPGIPDQPNTILRDVFGNQFDGEFLGTPLDNPLFYENFLPNGLYRGGLTGDLRPGGAFVTGFTVVPSGNILYVRPDYVEDPFLPGDDPDGSLARPFPTLAPEGPNNGEANFGAGFNPLNDRNGNGRFDRSAFIAARERSAFGPVVIVALPGLSQRDPISGVISQQPYVMTTPVGVNDASASVPAFTTLVMTPGTVLKMQNAALFVQNQGSALQLLGTASRRAVVTSYFDDTVAGDTNRDGADTLPRAGDWGGIVFRNFDDVSPRNTNLPLGNQRSPFPVDGTLGLSGADDVMSIVHFADVRYGGGSVPRTSGLPYDSITLFNSRPTISNTQIGVNNRAGAGASQASLSADFDSFREDDVARGPLIRRTDVANHSLNGIWVRPQPGNGIAQATNAIFYPDNLPGRGSARNFTFDDPLPMLLTSRLFVGEGLIQNSGGLTGPVENRLTVNPGMVVKSRRGAGIDVRYNAFTQVGGSFVVGDRDYIDGFDADPNYAPVLANGITPNPNFRANSVGDATVLFTSLSDTLATTFFSDPSVVDPVTLQPVRRTIVPMVLSDNGSDPQPTPGNISPLSRWGNISITAGARATIDEAEFRYGGGQVNAPGGSLPSQPVLNLIGNAFSVDARYGTLYQFSGEGTRVSITNNTFFDSLDAPIAIDPDGLRAGDSLRPLQSGNPFFRGNIFQRNGVDGLAVLASVTWDAGGAVESVNPNLAYFNVSQNTIWDDNDLVYVVRGSIILAGYNQFGNAAPIPSYTGFGAEPEPAVVLTVQSTLPDTLLANGQRVARPGESAIIKMLNQFTGGVLGAGNLGTPGADNALDRNVGAGFVVGVDDGIDPPAPSPLIDQGYGSQMRFVGIGANETTGQTQVPVIITSLRDNTIGRTVRGVTMNQTLFQPLTRYRNHLGGALDGTAPQPGDGGKIFFGGLSLTDYNLFDPRGGNLIDNVDFRFLTRIEIQGGGVVDALELSGDDSITIDDDWRAQKQGSGIPGFGGGPTRFANQFNSSRAMTISNSSLDNFADAGVFVHPGFAALVRLLPPTAPPPGVPFFAPFERVGSLQGFGVDLFMLQNTITNMPVGVVINSETTNGWSLDGDTGQSAYQAVILHNTFYNTPVGFRTVAPDYNGDNEYSHVFYVVMNNIFANPSLIPDSFAIQSLGQATGSQAQYNLFHNFATNYVGGQFSFGNFGATSGDPLFRDPANRNFFLRAGSPAIDRSRSELGPYELGNMLVPVYNQVLDATGGIRNQVGRLNLGGGDGPVDHFYSVTSRDVITLPQNSIRGYFDQFIPVQPGTPNASQGRSGVPGSYFFAPIDGVRDKFGFLRNDDPSTPNVEFGSRPYLDLGAIEYRELFAPRVVAAPNGLVVQAIVNGAGPVELYQVDGIGGVNRPPARIEITFDRRIDPASINNRTVRLQASGGDGLFGNANSAADRFIDLGGRLGLDPVTQRTLIIDLSTAGLALASDLYRIVLVGDGADVIRDQQGNALDGENIVNGQQQPVPSGDGFPGGSFLVTFAIDTNPPEIVGGTFGLDPADDTNRPNDGITFRNPPGFIGSVTDTFPPANPQQGQTVNLYYANRATGMGEFVGTATTDANGNFRVVPNRPLPDTPYDAGADGVLGTADDGPRDFVEAYAVDQSGNVALLPSRAFFFLDTVGPQVEEFSPTAGGIAELDALGRVVVRLVFSENIDPASLTANSILISRAGGDGVFGNGNDLPVQIDANTVQVAYEAGSRGRTVMTFSLIGAGQNDEYRIQLLGTGANAIRDIAGNPLDGNRDGTPGGDFDSQFLVFNPGAAAFLFVGAGIGAGPVGSRLNPYPTITAALAAARTGDVVAVLPGIYNESIQLRSFVQVVSAGSSSTDTSLTPGNPLNTIIRPAFGSPDTITVSAIGVSSVGGLLSRISGFTISSPLLFDPAVGPINSQSIGLFSQNSNVLVDKNIFLNSSHGIYVASGGDGAQTPHIQNNLLVGNTVGAFVLQVGAAPIPTRFINNTVALNDVGLRVSSPLPVPAVDVVNNIFWQNASLGVRQGGAIQSDNPNGALVRFNLFSGNGPDPLNAIDDVQGVNFGFNAGLLGSTPDPLGNFVGDPAFVASRDPRPIADGPAVFFLEGNFDLSRNSAAIDNALNDLAPVDDLRSRGRVDIPGLGFPGRGPADLGAFENSGLGGIPAGGAFRVAGTSLGGGAERVNGRIFDPALLPNQIIVIFADRVDRSSVSPSDLVFTGNGLNSSNPLRATSVSWLDDITAVFTLSGTHNPNGTVRVAMAEGSVRSARGELLRGYVDEYRLETPGPITVPDAPVVRNPATPAPVAPPVMPPGTAPAPKPAPAPAPTPAPAPAPAPARPQTAAQRRAAQQAAQRQANQRRAAQQAAQRQANQRRAPQQRNAPAPRRPIARVAR